MKKRRVLLALGACGLIGASPIGRAQPVARPVRLGFISSSTTRATSPFLVALRQGLAQLGYEESRNLAIEYRFASSGAQLPAMAAELVRLKVDLILAGGSEGILAARDATRTIPIVMTNSGDAVRAGFAASLARPGGNITGMTQISPELAGKRLQLLREIDPGLSRVAVLWNPAHRNTPVVFGETGTAAAALDLKLASLEVDDAQQIDAAFAAMAKQGIAALVVVRDPLTVRQRTRIIASANRLRVPAVYESLEFVLSGGLMSYGADLADLFRRSAAYVDKILKGARPGDLPIEQPTKFELLLNLKTATAIGLTLPQSLLLRADTVIR